MELVFIGLAAAFASLLTFFSGFGLGTILSPVFILFFPVETAIALTGIVHFLNNLFKISLVWKQISWNTGLRFAAAALPGAFIGAALLLYISESGSVLYTYTLNTHICSISWIKLLIALLMLLFVVAESAPGIKDKQFGSEYLLPGGFLSGFFGGLSGNQGALRSMFLLKTGLAKEAYIATGIMIACVVDITRLGVYVSRLQSADISNNVYTLLTAVFSAFLGAYIGSKYLKKITMALVQRIVAVLLTVLALLLGTGII